MYSAGDTVQMRNYRGEPCTSPWRAMSWAKSEKTGIKIKDAEPK